jgi:regulator of sirC expression with transglutaminase-like and TPR domain
MAHNSHNMDAVERFTALMARRGPSPALDVAALAIAAGADPTLEPDLWLAELDRLAAGVDSLEGLVRRLFVEERFTGNATDYHDPSNCLLNEVLARQLGIPITLSIVCMEVGRRAGVPLEGIGMPGHFLVRPVGTDRYLDAFAGGELLDLAGCEERFRLSTGAGPNVTFGSHLLTTAPTRSILARILTNLRTVYHQLGRPADVEWVLRMRLALPGVTAAELVELGHALAQQGRFLQAARLLEDQAEEWPHFANTLVPAAHALRAQLN